MSAWSTALAVAGTLSGVLVTTRSTRLQQREARAETRRADALAAVSALVAALADHRRAMWVREETRLRGGDETAQAAARDTSHATRSQVTDPWVRVRVLLPSLAAAADRAVTATFDMHDAADLALLDEQRIAAKTAADHLVAAAAARFNPAARRRWARRLADA